MIMNKKSFILSTLLSISAIIAFSTPPKTSAIIADYEQTVKSQQDSANTVINGTVIGTNYFTYFTNFTKSINYDLRINEVIKGDNLKVGDIVTFDNDCGHASEMVTNMSVIECFNYTPKIGNDQTMYLNMSSGTSPSQALIYGDKVVGVNMVINSITCAVAFTITIITLITIIIIKIKRKKTKAQ